MSPDPRHAVCAQCAHCIHRGAEVSALLERVRALEKRAEELIEPTVNDHDDKLELHAEQLASLTTATARLAVDMDRMASALSFQGLTLGKVEKTIDKVAVGIEALLARRADAA